MLRRTKAGPFTLEQAKSLDFLHDTAKARALTRMVLPLTAGLDDIPALPVTPDQARLLRQGQMLFGIPATPGLHLATEAETPVALVEISDGWLQGRARVQPMKHKEYDDVDYRREKGRSDQGQCPRRQ